MPFLADVHELWSKRLGELHSSPRGSWRVISLDMIALSVVPTDDIVDVDVGPGVGVMLGAGVEGTGVVGTGIVGAGVVGTGVVGTGVVGTGVVGTGVVGTGVGAGTAPQGAVQFTGPSLHPPRTGSKNLGQNPYCQLDVPNKIKHTWNFLQSVGSPIFVPEIHGKGNGS